jgi:hypothetical protein
LRITWRAVLSAGGALPKPTSVRGRRHQHVEDALLGGVLGARALALHLAFALLLDGHLDQVADDGVHVLAHIAHLGELGGLDLDEGRVGQPRQAARDLGLAHAGGPDHQDVLRRDLAAQLLGTCWRRQRLRSAMATARLAACWPTMWRSSSETISCGVMDIDGAFRAVMPEGERSILGRGSSR